MRAVNKSLDKITVRLRFDISFLTLCQMTNRQAIIALLRRGIITKSEAARLASVSRQTINVTCKKLNIDAQGARKQYLATLLERPGMKKDTP